MNTKLIRSMVIAALVAGAAATVYAGGWSIITFNEFPDHAIGGKPLTLTFSVRQHGNNLLPGLKPALKATTKSGLQIDVDAKPTANDGEYSATLRLVPDVGEWIIRVDGGFNPDDKTRSYNAVTLPPLSVVREGAASAPVFSEAERGSRLFIAKGCVGCHAAGSETDLSQKQFAADYLKKVLADPSIRTKDMPNLKLKVGEISALTAFINSSYKKKGSQE